MTAICAMCKRERTVGDPEHPMDTYDYSLMQVITGQPFGWFTGTDESVCPEDMEKSVRGNGGAA